MKNYYLSNRNQVALPFIQKYCDGFPSPRSYSFQTSQVLQMHFLSGLRSWHVALPVEQYSPGTSLGSGTFSPDMFSIAFFELSSLSCAHLLLA